MGLLLVVAVGSNYALFFDRITRSAHAHLPRTLASMLFANLTTVAGFGLLAFSNVSILQAMGVTVAPGVILALIYSAIFARQVRCVIQRWQPTLLIRASIALHGLALVAVIAEPAQWRWALGAVVINHLLLTAVGLWPRSHWLGPNWTRLPAAATARNEIALTIDDGPDPLVTPQVLDILDRYAAQATFFCVGEKAARYPDLCREIVRRGHAVENHSQHHRHHFSLLGPRGFMRELQAAQNTLSLITGQRPVFFRAPAGLRNPFLDPRAGATRPDARQLVGAGFRHPDR